MKKIPNRAVEAVITDPPYGTETESWDKSLDEETIHQCLCISGGYSVFFYSNTRLWHILPIIKRASKDAWVAVWHKSNSIGFERRFAPQWSPIVIAYSGLPAFWGKDLCCCPIVPQNVDHPTPKPIEVASWCVKHATSEANIVFDPFCGSGTILIAAKKLRRHFLGFDISPKYCDTARRRLALIDAQPSLFEPRNPVGNFYWKKARSL